MIHFKRVSYKIPLPTFAEEPAIFTWSCLNRFFGELQILASSPEVDTGIIGGLRPSQAITCVNTCFHYTSVCKHMQHNWTVSFQLYNCLLNVFELRLKNIFQIFSVDTVSPSLHPLAFFSLSFCSPNPSSQPFLPSSSAQPFITLALPLATPPFILAFISPLLPFL